MRRRPGLVMCKLAELLTKAFRDQGYSVHDVDPDALTEATGYNRTSRSILNESLRWEIYVQRADLPNLSFWVTSWTTMTEIIRSGGIKLTQDGPLHFWADSRDK